ncbi:MAG: DoxX family membrane protein [Chloroflexi bacterium]|nr:DoxX family membrane protein [Chloroflexota bacterium]
MAHRPISAQRKQDLAFLRVLLATPILWLPGALYSDRRTAGFWLAVRLYLGYVWFTSGWEKLTGHSLKLGGCERPATGGAWIGSTRGRVAVERFVDAAVACAPGCKSDGHPAVPGWYAAFLKRAVRPRAAGFAAVVAWGELLVGAGLLFGALTGAAAFFGVLMNVCFLLAGARRSNLKLVVLGALVMRAHRVAGYYGVDRSMLPTLQMIRGGFR